MLRKPQNKTANSADRVESGKRACAETGQKAFDAREGRIRWNRQVVTPCATQVAKPRTQIAAQKRPWLTKQAGPRRRRKDSGEGTDGAGQRLPPPRRRGTLEKQLVDVRAKLAVDNKVIEGQGAESRQGPGRDRRARKRLADRRRRRNPITAQEPKRKGHCETK